MTPEEREATQWSRFMREVFSEEFCASLVLIVAVIVVARVFA